MKTEIFEINNLLVLVHDYEEDSNGIILEAKVRGNNLIGQYSYVKHQPHNPTGDYHLHVYKKGNEIFSINASGRGHDGYSGTRIPNDVHAALQAKFPDWNWPDDQIIESLNENYILLKRPTDYLRKVIVSDYRVLGSNVTGFSGYFHTFADDPFLTGGNGGWINRTVAIIETENGSIRKVPVEMLRFLDS